MKTYAMFNYEYLFNDHFAKISEQAKLLYVKMMFFANCGFVPNPVEILDSLGYDKGILNELISNGEILTIPNRCEVFITSYFIHNHNFKPTSWMATPYFTYWRGKLWIKKNGVATFKPQDEQLKESVKAEEEKINAEQNKSEENESISNPQDTSQQDLDDWNKTLAQLN